MISRSYSAPTLIPNITYTISTICMNNYGLLGHNVKDDSTKKR